MKAGIFGGTFDPVHNGHLITALAVKEIRKLDKIIFVPNNVSPFKVEKQTSPAIHRLNMLKAAAEEVPFFEVSGFEINKPGVSYSVDTVKYFKSLYDDIEFIIGYDTLLDFDRWKEPDEIVKFAKLIVLKRDSVSSNRNKYFDAAQFVNTPLVEISATGIRKRVKENLPINFLVPQKVMEYIYNSNLYK